MLSGFDSRWRDLMIHTAILNYIFCQWIRKNNNVSCKTIWHIQQSFKNRLLIYNLICVMKMRTVAQWIEQRYISVMIMTWSAILFCFGCRVSMVRVHPVRWGNVSKWLKENNMFCKKHYQQFNYGYLLSLVRIQPFPFNDPYSNRTSWILRRWKSIIRVMKNKIGRS